jgi:hypothetical protein
MDIKDKSRICSRVFYVESRLGACKSPEDSKILSPSPFYPFFDTFALTQPMPDENTSSHPTIANLHPRKANKQWLPLVAANPRKPSTAKPFSSSIQKERTYTPSQPVDSPTPCFFNLSSTNTRPSSPITCLSSCAAVRTPAKNILQPRPSLVRLPQPHQPKLLRSIPRTISP